MHYYFVWVRSNRYHGSEPLTYATTAKLIAGSIVEVELQKESVLGVVVSTTTRPRFKTKSIQRVLDLPPIPNHLLRLMQWVQRYYPAPIGMLTQQLLPAQLSDKHLSDYRESDYQKPDLSTLPPLTAEQSTALAAMHTQDTYILHGTTGSGKTRLYIELSARTLSEGKSAIILTPEISLTAQLSHNFRSIFGDSVLVMHSQQTPAERRQAWLHALHATQPLIIIGPRSALFSPVPKLGLIVLDEAHEAAYKQEQAPQYQAGRVASYLSGLTRATLVLGSATPSVSDYYLAEQKQKPIIVLKDVANKNYNGDRQITVVDRKDHSLFARSSYLSQPLLTQMAKTLENGEQILLYLNRRGTARMVLCENCGWQATCPHCDIPLTYHGDHHELRCHSCSHRQSAPVSCPECAHPNIGFKTAGTKAIVSEVERLFPEARVARFDTDNAKAERFEQHYEAVKRGDVDILVGTQMLAKGLDLPRLSTLGILLADTSLYLPDFSAQERTYQLITQVLGRIGRGHTTGHAIIQTYHPEHPVLVAAIANDYRGFYQSELASRQQFMFPPFCHLLKLTVRRATSKSAELAAQKLKTELAAQYKVQIEGPAPSFHERFQNKYQWQLVVKAQQRSELINIVQSLPANWSHDLDPLDLL